ncbi:MAG: tyrosine-type recombinase/integrase [Erysipelotrichaceae bacterium]|nr:tyrosine-type recombinase/integrase [Erysipelotrichaceae bacterium]
MIDNGKSIFTGTYKEVLEGYVEYKSSLGYNIYCRQSLNQLIQLNEFLDSYNSPSIVLTEDMAYAYIELYSHLSSGTIHIKESCIRQFGIYLNNMNYENIFIYPENLIKVKSDFVPYIFNYDEISRIFEATDKMKDNSEQSKKVKLFYQTLIRLLYGTGMRISEVLNLRIENVDLISKIIIVNNGKENVSRLIPVNESVFYWLKKYYDEIACFHKKYFFESTNGKARRTHSINKMFRKILIKAKIDRKPDNTGPRLHDLRHTFACHCLDKMIKDGKDPYCALPYLSTYLGHKGIESTEKYLRLTEDHYKEITDAGHYIYKESLGENYE